MKNKFHKFIIATVAFTLCAAALAQTDAPVATTAPALTNTPAVAAIRNNPAIVPVSRDARSLPRQNLVLQRAKDNPGPCDIAFIGDSITQGWEGNGKNVWTNYYGKRKCLNFGVGGDRTEHVLWRFENGQLDGIEAEILEGIQAIIKEIRTRLPETKLLVLGIFPRGQTFSPQRGKLLQINQALAKVADGQMIHYLDFGSQLIEADGSLSKDIMPDALHLSQKGYEIWAQAIEPKLKELLAN